MNTALRIASVTYVLKDLLNNGLIDGDVHAAVGVNVIVTAKPPDRIIDSSNNEPSQLNLFMYKVSPNQGWRNVGLPSLNGKGERIANPPLAIDLHYLLTAYGAAELHTDILLGYGMQLLHETPVLGREAIRKSLALPTAASGSLPDALKLLSTSELAEQAEQIKITPEYLNVEELSKLWAAFQPGHYRPSAAYKVTVVLIESSKSTKPGLPVKERNIYVVPFQKPVIEKIMSQSAAGGPIVENQKILSGDTLVLVGRKLKAEVVEVNIDDITITEAEGLNISDSQISFVLPDELKAGVHGVQVVHPRLMGSPPVAHTGVTSTSETFVLNPQIENMIYDASTGNIDLKINPAIDPGQQVILFLNELTNSNNPRAYSFQMSVTPLSPPEPRENISILTSDVKAGDYLVRIRVDNTESPLKPDTPGQFNLPKITIP